MANDQTQNMNDPFGLNALFGLTPSVTNANPYTDQILKLLTGQQASTLGGMGNAYGSMADLLKSSLNNFNPSNFLSQFMQNAGGLGSLAQGSQVGQDALMKQANTVGQQAVQDVAGQFAGLGSLYSGGAAQEATKALAAPMFSAMQQGSAQQAGLLNNLYGSALSGLQSGNLQQMLAGLQGAGLFGQKGAAMGSLTGQLSDLLGGYGSPLVMSNPSLLQQLLGQSANFATAATALGGQQNNNSGLLSMLQNFLPMSIGGDLSSLPGFGGANALGALGTGGGLGILGLV